MKLHRVPHQTHPASKFAKYLVEIISKNVRSNKNSIINSKDFVNTIKNVTINEDEIICFFDVINFFTNLNVELAIEIIYMRQKNDITSKDRINLVPKTIYELLKLCAQNSNFSFNNKFYSQIRGAAMGSSLSSLLAEVIIQYVFNKATQNCPHPTLRILNWFVDRLLIIN